MSGGWGSEVRYGEVRYSTLERKVWLGNGERVREGSEAEVCMYVRACRGRNDGIEKGGDKSVGENHV